jgi:hypothetical protein
VIFLRYCNERSLVVDRLFLLVARVDIFVPVYSHTSERLRLQREEPIDRIISKDLSEVVIAVDVVLVSVFVNFEGSIFGFLVEDQLFEGC